MRKRVAALGFVTVCAVIAACIPAPPIPPPVTSLFKQIFWSVGADPNAAPPRREPHSCAVEVRLADANLQALYKTVDPYWNANGWDFWQSCVVGARSVGFALPTVKDNPACANNDSLLLLTFSLTTAPVFGVGSGHYSSFNATNFAVWCSKARVEAQG